MAGFELNEWIARPRDELFQFIANPNNAPKVVNSVIRMEQLTDGTLGVGTRYRETRLMNGKEQQTDLEIVSYEPPVHYAMRNVTQGIETTYTYTFTPERNGTQVRLVCKVNARGLKKLMTPLVAGILKKEDGDHLQRLRAAIENG